MPFYPEPTIPEHYTGCQSFIRERMLNISNSWWLKQNNLNLQWSKLDFALVFMCPVLLEIVKLKYYSWVKYGDQWIWSGEEETIKVLWKGYKMDFHCLQFIIAGKKSLN